MTDVAPADRRLTAILIADVVGYSKLMGADEAGTLNRLRSFQSEIFGPSVSGHRGRIVKALGDGWLVEFSSAISAVNCAMQVQDRLSQERPFEVRIGVHTGDVIHDDDDVFGDGVNIAARLEGLAAPGGIAISDMVYSSLDGTMRPSFDDGGERELKNITRPVRVWTRDPAPEPKSLVEPTLHEAPEQTGFPHLTLVPLAASDPREEIRDLADAVTNDLGLYFGSIGWMRNRTAQQPGRGYVLAGKLRSRGEKLRLEVRLDAPGGASLWSGKFDGELGDSFDWQDRVSEDVASNVIGFLFDSEIARLARIPREQRTAEQCFLHGLLRRGAMTNETFVEGLTDFSLALGKDPTLTEAYAEAIFFAMGGRTMGYTSELDQFAERHAIWMERAGPLAQDSPVLDLCIATANFFMHGDTRPLRLKIMDALRRDPFDARILVFSGWGSLWCGETGTGLDCFRKVAPLARYGPYASIAQGGLALATLQTGNDEAALQYAEAGIETHYPYSSNHYVRAAALAHLGRQDEAEAAMKEAMQVAPRASVTAWKSVNDYGGSEGGQRYFEGLRLAGLPA